MSLDIRPAEPRDASAWAALRAALWPDEDATLMREEARAHFAGKQLYPAIFVAEDDGALIGFVEASIRSHAEGCYNGPAPFVEGWFVSEHARKRGVGRALIAAVEDWARAQGFTELASDATLENVQSHAAHGALGFQEVERLVAFRKDLRRS